MQITFGSPLTIVTQSPPPPSVTAWVTSVYDGFRITSEGTNLAYTLPDDKQITVQISYVDSHGNPAQVQGNVEWASSNTDIVTVTPAGGVAQQTQATVRPGATAGSLGQAQVTATADADLGEGTTNIVSMFDVEVVAGAAVAGTITPVGDPQPITPDAPTGPPGSNMPPVATHPDTGIPRPGPQRR